MGVDATLRILLLLMVIAATESAELTKGTDRFKGELSYKNGEFLAVKCATGVADALNRSDSKLQRLNDNLRVKVLTIRACEPPSGGYSHLLELLNVWLLPQSLVVLSLPRTGAPLCADHFTGNLTYLTNLTLYGDNGKTPSPCANLLSKLPELKRLEVRSVPLPRDLLVSSPLGNISSLTLANVGAVRVPASVLAGLIGMSMTEKVLFEGPAPSARIVSLKLSKNQSLNATLFPAATSMSIEKWNEREKSEWAPTAWKGCSVLTKLRVISTNFSSLPDRWLAECTVLEMLEINTAIYLKTLPSNLLEGSCASPRSIVGPCPSPALKKLVIKYSGLTCLPNQLFDPVKNLQHLDLSHNKLMLLPGGIFTYPIDLKILNLASNKLENSVYGTIEGLIQLNELDLSNNYNLSDSCKSNQNIKSGDSSLVKMKKLIKLDLSGTRVSRICSDWRMRMLDLQTLDLSNTNIARLSYDDMQYKRNALNPKAVVKLLDTNVSVIDYGPEEEANAMTAPNAVVQIILNIPLQCNCDLFRAVRAMRYNPSHVDFLGLMCDIKPKPRSLKLVPLDDMLCDQKCDSSLPAGCFCAERIDGPEKREFLHIRVSCEHNGLREFPKVPMDDKFRKWDLRLAFNNITVLDKLSPSVRMLDLRNNSLERVSADAATALGQISELHLVGNRPVCDCNAILFLDAVARLQQSNNGTDDASQVFCEDGRSLVTAVATRHTCFARDNDGGSGSAGTPLLIALGVSMGVLLLAALALIAVLAKPTRRARLKGVLLRWGWLPRASEPEDARPYDVFLSFAHEDEEFARELAARLETGPRPLRLCLHSRDWAPGEFIDAQIAASVRSARRTLCVVSRHFAASRWTRVELREALAEGAREGTPRLVLVLLEEASALPALDRELRRCLARCTYLQRDHPRFWERLREALPQPRRLEPEPALAPATAAAAA